MLQDRRARVGVGWQPDDTRLGEAREEGRGTRAGTLTGGGARDTDGAEPRVGNLKKAGFGGGAETSSRGLWRGRKGKVLGTEHWDGFLLEGLGERLPRGLEERPMGQA